MIRKIFKGFTTAIVAAFMAVLSNSAISLIAQVLGYAGIVENFLASREWLSAIMLVGLFIIWTIVLFDDKVTNKS